ncbi:MAG: histidinol-phosphatase HisJ family protein [Bacillota bacterium]
MKIPIDYHQHLERGPLTPEWALRFIDQGGARGVQEFGFSEHFDRFREAGHLRCNHWKERDLEDIDGYFALLQGLRDEGYPIRIGIEVDFVAPWCETTREFLSAYPFDYILGSVHWLGDWGFDDPRNIFEWDGRDVEASYREYYQLLAQAARSGLFDSLAHPDLIKIYGYRPTEPVEEAVEEALQAVATAGIALEINTAGIRKPVGEIYPAPALLSRARHLGIPITLGSDAHEPADAGRDLDRAVELARAAGYTEVVGFDRRQRRMLPI